MAKAEDVKRAELRGYQKGYRKGRRERDIAVAYAEQESTQAHRAEYRRLPLANRMQIAGLSVAEGTRQIKAAAAGMESSREFLASAMQMLDDLLVEVEAVATHPFAPADTSPEGGDPTKIEAPFTGGAVAATGGETPKLSSPSGYRWTA